MLVEVYNLCDMFLWGFFLCIICQGNVDASKVNQVGPEYHYHYAQRKMVDFIRKRYQILEKALNLEYAVVLSFSLSSPFLLIKRIPYHLLHMLILHALDLPKSTFFSFITFLCPSPRLQQKYQYPSQRLSRGTKRHICNHHLLAPLHL